MKEKTSRLWNTRYVNEPSHIVNKHIKWYEKQYPQTSNRKDVPNQEKIDILGWLGESILAVRERNIGNAIKSILKVHDIYFEYIIQMDESPWDDEFDALMVKYGYERD